jgi:nucleoside-diphosphate-sugar epimerase
MSRNGCLRPCIAQATAARTLGGFSPVPAQRDCLRDLARLRDDVVVNNPVWFAFATGAVHLMSDGSPWRPLGHVEDISVAFPAALEAPPEAGPQPGLQRRPQPGERPDPSGGGDGPRGGTRQRGHLRRRRRLDRRDYRVDCAKPARVLGVEPCWMVRGGVEQLYEAFKVDDLTAKTSPARASSGSRTSARC